MDKVSYQGYAQSAGFDPVKVSNANVEAIARDGARTIAGMKAFAEQDLANRKAQLDAMTRNNRAESENRDMRFKLRQENRSAIQEQKRINAEIEINNLKVGGNTTAAIFKSLSPLSEAATQITKNIVEARRTEKETSEFWSNVLFGVNPDEVFRDLQAEKAVEIGGEAIEIRADQAEAMGADPIAVNAIRAQNPARDLRSKKARIVLAAQNFKQYADQAFQDENLEVSFISNGEQVTVKATEAVTSSQRAALYPEILKRYMVQNGLHTMKATVLAPFYESVYKQYTSDIDNIRKVEVGEAQAKRAEDAKDYLADTKSVDAFQNYFRVLKRQKGYVEARKDLFTLVYTATDGNGNMLFTDADIAQFEATAFDDQPTKAIGERYTADVATYRSQRRKAMSGYFGEMEQAKSDAEKQWTNAAEEWVQNEWDGNQQQLEDLINTAIQSGNASGAKALQPYLSFSNEAKQDEYFTELWAGYEALGTLTQEEVRRAPVSDKVKAEWVKKAKAAEATAISKDSQKLIDDYISSSLQKRLNYSSIDSTKDPTYFRALDYAKRKALKDFRLHMLQPGMSEQQAIQNTLDQFQRDFNNESGTYAVTDGTETGGKYEPKFRGFVLKGQSAPAYPLNKARELIRTHSDALDSQVLIPDSELKRMRAQVDQGKELVVLPAAQAIANEYGGRINAIEVVNRQLKRAGLEQIPVKAFQQRMQNVDPTYQRLLNYRPTTTRATIAAVGSGMGAAPAPRIPNRVNSAGEILSTWLAVGGDPKEAVLMTAIAMAESSGRQDAHNPNASTGDNSYGLWQINMINDLGPARRQQFGINSNDQLFDPATNARAALAIRKSQGFGAWSVYRSGAYKQYLAAAERAMASYGEGPWRQGMNMNPRVIEYITGDRNHPRYRTDHGGSNYHEHIAYATPAEALLAARKLEAQGIKVTELKGHSPVGSHSTNSYHYSGRAFDVPADQVPVGQEQALSKRVRAILGIN